MTVVFHDFPGQNYFFPEFSIPKVICHGFPDAENFYFKVHDFSDLSRDLYEPCIDKYWVKKHTQ